MPDAVRKVTLRPRRSASRGDRDSAGNQGSYQEWRKTAERSGGDYDKSHEHDDWHHRKCENWRSRSDNEDQGYDVDGADEEHQKGRDEYCDSDGYDERRSESPLWGDDDNSEQEECSDHEYDPSNPAENGERCQSYDESMHSETGDHADQRSPLDRRRNTNECSRESANEERETEDSWKGQDHGSVSWRRGREDGNVEFPEKFVGDRGIDGARDYSHRSDAKCDRGQWRYDGSDRRKRLDDEDRYHEGRRRNDHFPEASGRNQKQHDDNRSHHMEHDRRRDPRHADSWTRQETHRACDVEARREKRAREFPEERAREKRNDLERQVVNNYRRCDDAEKRYHDERRDRDNQGKHGDDTRDRDVQDRQAEFRREERRLRELQSKQINLRLSDRKHHEEQNKSSDVRHDDRRYSDDRGSQRAVEDRSRPSGHGRRHPEEERRSSALEAPRRRSDGFEKKASDGDRRRREDVEHTRKSRRDAETDERRRAETDERRRRPDVRHREKSLGRRGERRRSRDNGDRDRRTARGTQRKNNDVRAAEPKKDTVAALAPRSSSAAALAALKAQEKNGHARARPALQARSRSRSPVAVKPRREIPTKKEANSKDGQLRWVYVATVPDEVRNWQWFRSRQEDVVKVQFVGRFGSDRRQAVVEMGSEHAATTLVKSLASDGLTATTQASAELPHQADHATEEKHSGARSSPSRSPPRPTSHVNGSSGGAGVDIWAVAGVLAGAVSAGAAASGAVASTVDPCWVFVKNLAPEAAKRPLQWFQKKCGGHDSPLAPVRGILCASLPGGAADGSAVLLRFSTSSVAESMITAVDGWKLGVPRMKAQLATKAQTEAVNCCWLLVRELDPTVRSPQFFKKINEGVQKVLFYNEPKNPSEISQTQDSAMVPDAAAPSRLALVEVRTPESAAELCAALNGSLQQGSMSATQISEVQKEAIEARVEAAVQAEAEAAAAAAAQAAAEAAGEADCDSPPQPEAAVQSTARERSTERSLTRPRRDSAKYDRHGQRADERRQRRSRSRRTPRERSGNAGAGGDRDAIRRRSRSRVRGRSERIRRDGGSTKSPARDRRSQGRKPARGFSGRRPSGKGDRRGPSNERRSRRERSWTLTRPGH